MQKYPDIYWAAEDVCMNGKLAVCKINKEQKWMKQSINYSFFIIPHLIEFLKICMFFVYVFV